jgi:glycosyltransferase involved in cell wall biosynthesis
MKILFVIDILDTHNNGTSISAQRFAKELERCGHEVRVLCANPQETDEKGVALPVEVTGKYNVPEFIVPLFDSLIKKHGFAYGDFLPRSRPIIREAVEWADVVHSYFPFPLDIVASNYAAKIGKPNTGAFHVQPENITMSLHCGKVQWVQNMIYRLFRNTFYYKYRHIHVPSAFMGRMLEERDYKAKIHVISNGIQDAFMEAGENKIDNGRPPKLPEYQDKIVIMMVGRLAKEKRQDVIINAVNHSKYADKIQLVFAGKGPQYEKYVKLSEKLANPPQFVYVKQDELIKLLLQCDLYVHASDMESEAISCIEAFATGLVPVIANSELSATRQFALDDRSLFLPGNPKDLARAIDYWLDNPKERENMEKTYIKAAKKYSLSISVRKFEEMLNEEIEEQNTLSGKDNN